MFIKQSPERITLKGYKRDDCTINAIGNAAGLSYDLARKVLQTAIFHRNTTMGFVESKPRTKAQFIMRSHVLRLCRHLSVDDEWFMSDEETYSLYTYNKAPKNTITLKDFANEKREGIYIVVAKGHLSVVTNGKIIDTWDSGHLPVEGVCKIDVKRAQSAVMDIANFYGFNSDKHIIKNYEEKLLKAI